MDIAYENIKNKGLQYSRKEMENLRFVNIEEQKKKWVEIYCGLDPMVAQEYERLFNLDKNPSKNALVKLNFDPCVEFENYATWEDASISSINDEMLCVNVDEDIDEDNESDEDYTRLLKPAFSIRGEPDFDSGPPQDGWEYLRRVRWEAARIPKVIKAGKIKKNKEQSFYMPQIPDIMKCSESLLPCKDWEESFLKDFSELRQAVAERDPENENSKNSTKSRISENVLVHLLEDSCPSESHCKSETSDAEDGSLHSPKFFHRDELPTLTRLLKMSPTSRIAMLKRRIKSMQKMKKLPYNEGLWLFCLCAIVDQPLDGDGAAAMRSLLRKCASLRALKCEVDEEVVILNIIVAISGLFFGQQDL